MNDSREAKIEALWPQYDIDDLGLHLKMGQVEHVPNSLANRSRDLRAAIRLGAVRVSLVKRCRVSKLPSQPAPPANRRIKAPPKKEIRAEVDEESIAEKVAAKLARSLDQRDAKLRGELRDMVSKGGTVDAAELAALLSQSLTEKIPVQQVVMQQGSGTSSETSEVGDEPHYIPSKIIPTNAKVNIRTSETKSDASQTDDAKAKLAALRRKKKGKGNE